MASLQEIRRRIRSVKNTQQITKAMKMVAAAKLRRSTERVTAARPYAKSLTVLLSSLASRVGEESSPLLARRDEKNVLLLVVTGDKGLCGAFNTNILRAATIFLKQKESEGRNVRIVAIGRKSADFFRRRKWEVVAAYPGIFSRFERKNASEIAAILRDEFVVHETEARTEEPPRADAVYAIYNEFKSVIQQNLRTDRLLPIEAEKPSAEASAVTVDYLYEPSAEELISQILPRYLEFQIFRILLESGAAEHGARMTAMDGATKNAGEMIDSLTLNYNRARQARITKELIEIVSGAAALK